MLGAISADNLSIEVSQRICCQGLCSVLRLNSMLPNPDLHERHSQIATETNFPFRVARSLRYLSWAALISALIAFLGRYGYPVWMTPLWLFVILPCLALLACSLSTIAVAMPWQPSKRPTFAWTAVVVGLYFPIASGGLLIALHTLSRFWPHWELPRLVMFILATSSMLLVARLHHGLLKGRILASLAYGLGVLQGMTSLVECFFSNFAP